MKQLFPTLIFTGILMVVPALFSLPATSPQSVVRPDPALGPPPTGGGDSWGPILTPDGRYVLFASRANNLATGSNGVYLPSVPPHVNVFLRDRTNGTTILISVNTSGTAGGNGDSFPTAISTNGQFVLFEGTASNLVTNDANNASDVFLRDVVNNSTVLVSVNINGQSGSDASQSSTMTPDGRYVAFSSLASNLVSGDVNGIADIFVRDMLAGTTTLASPNASQGRCDSPALTPDGRYVAFLSTSADVVLGATASSGDVYVRDLIGLTTICASTTARGASTFASFFGHAISDDGQYVAFESASPTRLTGNIFRYNLSTGTMDVVASNLQTSVVENMDFRSLDMTPDGRFVTYVGNTNSGTVSTINLWDGLSNSTTLVSGPLVQGNYNCALPSISSNGQFVTYLSYSTQLVPLPVGSNTVSHLYLWNSATASNSLVDMDPNGQVSFDRFMSRPCMTPDGRFVAFDATDSNLGGDPRAAYYNVYLSDQTSNSIELISSRQPNLPSATARALSIKSVFSVSSNGQFIAYVASANRVSTYSATDYRMVFVSDLFHGTTAVANVDTNGVADTNGYSIDPAISANGRYVAFTSSAGDLVPDSVATGANIYVRDLQLGTTAPASLNLPLGGLGNYSPMIDAGGSHVAYLNNTNGMANVFYTDLQSNFSVEVSAKTTSNVVAAAMTPDGRYVAFAGQPELWDSQTGTIVYQATASSVSLIAVSADGNRLAYVANRVLYGVDRAAGSNWTVAANAFAPYAKLQFSGDSRYLVYVSTAAITPNDTNGLEDVYRYDFQANTNLLISQSTAGDIANGPSDSPAISWDGRFIAYRSFASNLVASVANGFPQIYLFDNQTGATTLASASAFTGGPGNNRSLAPVFSGDSTTLVFQSWASDLLTNDFGGGGGVFALSVAVSPPALIGVIQISPTGVPVVSWPANAGTNFQLQYKDNLADPAWLPLPGGITVISNIGSIIDSSPNSQQRFYRVHSN